MTQSTVLVNFGNQRAMRAPGHPQSCTLTEAAMDDLADKLGMDPLEFRLKNLSPTDFHTPIYEAELKIGAELIGWSEKRKPRGKNGAGPIKRGLGVALHQWGGGGGPGQEGLLHHQPRRVGRAQDGDPGPGHRHPHRPGDHRRRGAGPQADRHHLEHRQLDLPAGPGFGRLDHDAVDGAAGLRRRHQGARRVLQEDRPGRPGRRRRTSRSRTASSASRASRSWAWKDACRKLGMATISETGEFQQGLSSSGVGGCQFAEVAVDVETGVVKVKKIVAIQDSGLIIDKLTWESQVYGGVIMGLNYGLFEERIVDPTTGAMLNPDMELYKLAGAVGHPRDHRSGLRARRAEGPRRDRRRRAPDDLDGRRHRQRRGQRHRRARDRVADVTPKCPERPGHGIQRREGVIP